MVGGTPPHLPGEDDDHEDFALEFPAGDEDSEGSVLDAFDAYVTVEEEKQADGDPDGPEIPHDDDEELAKLLFIVANPAGTVTVSAYMDGRIQRIELTAKVTDMTESHLADEILVIADLARQKGRSAQYEFISGTMRELGQDNVTTRDFLARDLQLPSPEEAIAAEAKVFANRYASDDD